MINDSPNDRLLTFLTSKFVMPTSFKDDLGFGGEICRFMAFSLMSC